ncbi:MAG: hypothetical protein PWP34_925 [Desulfuromonadales bacterium]|jgi:mannosyltransferase OCH1-like enzyme|nr:hypothetical protein [Desulfuromonadales bacterium]
MVEVEKLHGWLPRIIHQTYADRDSPNLYRKNIDNYCSLKGEVGRAGVLNQSRS